MSENKLQNMISRMEVARAKELGLTVEEYRRMIADKESRSKEEASKYVDSKECEQDMKKLKED
ncbi:hypothetical protein [Bacillus mycoides]|uniref:hypothetical protein n=1 Tax=Bacillus mycoides TaxID=1405 RepID=UPI003A8078B7